jgi:hypothetical protein
MTDVIDERMMREHKRRDDPTEGFDRFVRLKIDDPTQHGKAILIAVGDGGVAHGLPDHTLLVRQSRLEKIARAGIVFHMPDVALPPADARPPGDPTNGS